MGRVKKIRVRRATQDQVSFARDLDRQCLPGCVWYPGEYWWLAWHKDEPVGYAGLARSHQWRNCGYLCRSGVLPEYRGLGLHRRMIRTRISFARSLGWEYLFTDTRQNCASANNLIHCGFRLYDPQNPWSFSDACYWRLKLTR